MAGEVLSKQRLEEIREDVYQVHEWSGIDIRHSDVRLLIETIDHYVLRAEAAEREAEECRKLREILNRLRRMPCWDEDCGDSEYGYDGYTCTGCQAVEMYETLLAAKGGEDGK